MPSFTFGYTSIYFFAFFAISLLLYWVCPKRFRYVTLLVISLLFYALMDMRSLGFIIGSILTLYFFSLAISNNQKKQKEYLAIHKTEMSLEEKKSYKTKQKKKRKCYLILAIVLNLAMLFVMKYTNFVIDNINGFISLFNSQNKISELNLFLPLGISFYVFQGIGYIVDVYWQKTEAETNLIRFALFTCYFPKVMQGPLLRYEDMKEQLFGEHEFNYDQFTDGMKRALYGYMKKLVIADTLIGFITFGFGNVLELSGLEAILLVVFYFIQDYSDFSGYMDISIGLSNCMGIVLPENFNHPYFAIGIDDYWRRWHSTLGQWFKDYIFYPLSISKFSLAIGKACKKIMPEFGKKIPAIFGLIVVWFLTGLWHGASWNYVLWGLYFGFIIILSVIFQPLINRFYEKTKLKDNIFWKIFQHIRTLLLLAIGKTIFMSGSIVDAFNVFARMFTPSNNYVDITNINNQLGYISMIVALLGFVIVLVIDIIQEAKPETTFLQKFDSKPLYVQWPLLILLTLMVIWFGFYGSGLPHYDFGYIQF